MKLWLVAGISAGGAALAGYLVYTYLKKNMKASTGDESTANNAAKIEFASNTKAFSGLYGPLYKIARGSGKFRTGVIGDWAARTENLQNAQSYIEYWRSGYGNFTDWSQEEGCEKCENLLSFIFESGICRSGEDNITVDNSTYKRYDYTDEMIEEGVAGTVKAPYWYYGDTILEKGIIQHSV